MRSLDGVVLLSEPEESTGDASGKYSLEAAAEALEQEQHVVLQAPISPPASRQEPPSLCRSCRRPPGRIRSAASRAWIPFAARPAKKFSFRTLGQMAAIGQRTGVADILGMRFSGFIAWWLWRTVYLSKLPGWDRKVRVALQWTLDVLCSKDVTQYFPVRSPVMSREDVEDLLPAA